jgi:hypothetical protein
MTYGLTHPTPTEGAMSCELRMSYDQELQELRLEREGAASCVACGLSSFITSCENLTFLKICGIINIEKENK